MAVKDVRLRVPATCRPKGAREHDKNEITETIEEYVEGIWRLQREMDTVGTGDIAKYMNVAPASVTTMLKRLAEMGFVEHTPYEFVRCTEKGKDLAIELLRKHRLIERLLVDFLGLPWDDVHDLACKLEHYISADVADNISRALDNPKTCPHGNPVDATFEDGSWRLDDAVVGDVLRIVKITDERPEFLSYLYEVGLLPETQIKITERTPFGDVLTVEIEGRQKPLAVGREVSTAVWVRRE
ncbi:MAG TPA: metal-dependent transcriptional regulator [Chthonomonadales bacterium]|nr:metal-dependent transcriptional regulator [Chthonomonadales bacterium]